MHDELSVRQTAIRLRLADESVESICRTLKRLKTWIVTFVTLVKLKHKILSPVIAQDDIGTQI